MFIVKMNKTLKNLSSWIKKKASNIGLIYKKKPEIQWRWKNLFNVAFQANSKIKILKASAHFKNKSALKFMERLTICLWSCKIKSLTSGKNKQRQL